MAGAGDRVLGDWQITHAAGVLFAVAIVALLGIATFIGLATFIQFRAFRVECARLRKEVKQQLSEDCPSAA